MSRKNITVLGAGYVGLTTAAMLANVGFKVFLIEPNPKRLKIIKSGKSFFFEAGLDSLISKAIKEGNLTPTDSYLGSVEKSDFVFSCVGTPDKPDGSSNLDYVFSAAKKAAKYMKPASIYIQKSTVPVGTGLKVKEFLPSNVHYVSNPEFLREGTALHDSLFFDRIVVGGNEKNAVQKVINIYKKLEENRTEITKLAGIKTLQTKGEYISTNLNSAELIKVSANAFLALKISFANSIAKFADKSGANINEVMDAVGADKRIGRAFLNAGRGYGGGCFPKDVSGLISSAGSYGVKMPILEAATAVNNSMPEYVIEKIKDKVGKLEGKKAAVLGLSFKAGTSDSRRSPAAKIANILQQRGVIVRAYDPKANDEAKDELNSKVLIVDSLEEAMKDCDIIVVATDWPEFKALDFNKVKAAMSGSLVVDAMNCLDSEAIKAASIDYIGVGKN